MKYVMYVLSLKSRKGLSTLTTAYNCKRYRILKSGTPVEKQCKYMQKQYKA